MIMSRIFSSAEPGPQLTWTAMSDRLAIALACLAGVMAIALFLIEKTPVSVLVLLGLMLALLIFPVLHFFRGATARIMLFVVAIFGTFLFGWSVWPRTIRAVAETTQQPTPSPKPTGPSDSAGSGDSIATEVHRAQPTVEFSFQTTGDRRQQIRSSVVPHLIQLEPKPTGVKESDLPM